MDSYTIENLIRKYVELRKEVAKEYNYSVYPDYVGGIRKLSCNPINILINILKCTILGPIKIFLKIFVERQIRKAMILNLPEILLEQLIVYMNSCIQKPV